MRNINLLLLVFLIPRLILAQDTNIELNEAKFDQYPEIKKCKNKENYADANNCISEKVRRHITSKLNGSKIRKIVSRDIKNAFSREEWEQVIGAKVDVNCKIGVILGYDKNWRIKYVETEYPSIETYLYGFFENLPKIEQPAIYDGQVSDFVFHIPLKMQIVLK